MTSTPEIRFVTELITPERAKELLEKHNPHNRRLHQNWVRTLGAVMEEDDFVLTHQAVAFWPNGDVLDGQHRLAAIMLSEIAQEIVCAYYLTEKAARRAWETIDRGAKRNLGEVGEIVYGLPKPGRSRIGVANIIRAIESGIGHVNADHGVLEIAKKTVDAFDACSSRLGSRFATAPRLAAFVWMYSLDPVKIEKLCDVVASGVGLTENQALLRRILSSRKKMAGQEDRLQECLKAMRCIEACLCGEKLRTVPKQTRETLVMRLSSLRERNMAKLAARATAK